MCFRFRLQHEYDLLDSGCPPSDYLPKNVEVAFRWVYDNINNANNFLTQYEKEPSRFNEKSDALKCAALGLSFFDSLENAKNRFNNLKIQMGGKIYDTLGKHIAKGSIQSSDGVSGLCNNIGHFTHHSYYYIKLFREF